MGDHHITRPEKNQEAYNKHLGRPPSILLVRSDAYITFTGDEKSIAASAKLCDKWLESGFRPE